MSHTKKLFGIILILFSLSFLILLGFPQFYANNETGRLDKELEVSFEFLQKEEAQVVLLYFGYVGCKTICDPSLKELSQIEQRVDSEALQVYFIDLSKEIDPELPTLFASSFNKRFKALRPSKEELISITTTLGVKYSYSLLDKSEISHAGNIYLLTKEKQNYKQRCIYTARPYNIEAIASDIKAYLSQTRTAI